MKLFRAPLTLTSTKYHVWLGSTPKKNQPKDKPLYSSLPPWHANFLLKTQSQHHLTLVMWWPSEGKAERARWFTQEEKKKNQQMNRFSGSAHIFIIPKRKKWTEMQCIHSFIFSLHCSFSIDSSRSVRLAKISQNSLNITGKRYEQSWCCGVTNTLTQSLRIKAHSLTANRLHSHRNLLLWQLWVSVATVGDTKINRDWVTSCLTQAFLFWTSEPARG